MLQYVDGSCKGTKGRTNHGELWLSDRNWSQGFLAVRSFILLSLPESYNLFIGLKLLVAVFLQIQKGFT